MKKMLLYLSALAVITSFGSCKKDNAVPKKEVVVSIYIGTWKVKSYVSDGIDVTSDFDAYRFDIAENGIMQAYNENETVPGSWHCHELAKVLHIQFDAGFPLSGLSKSWNILSETSEEIHIQCLEGQEVLDVRLTH